MAGELLRRAGIQNKYTHGNVAEAAMIDPTGKYIESIVITDENLLAFDYIFHQGLFFKKEIKENSMELQFRRVRFMVTAKMNFLSPVPLTTVKEPKYDGGPEEEETHG